MNTMLGSLRINGVCTTTSFGKVIVQGRPSRRNVNSRFAEKTATLARGQQMNPPFLKVVFFECDLDRLPQFLVKDRSLS